MFLESMVAEKSVKGMVARAIFVSKAIVNEAERRAKKEDKKNG